MDLMINTRDILVPLDVPKKIKPQYIKNYFDITQGSGRLFLFAGDQKIEHLNDDFFGSGVHIDDADPDHLFKIADGGNVGVLATQLGLIARYGEDFRNVRYLVKLNSKTNIVSVNQADPHSAELAKVSDVVNFKKESGLNILGVGYTVYIGSEYEHKMLHRASEIIREAHANGLIAVIWSYPRGKAIKDKKDPHLVAGAAGVAACLGADFVKVDCPEDINSLKEALNSAGRTKVICAGGESRDPREFLKRLSDEIIVGAYGTATGRNIHQKSLEEAIKMCRSIRSLVIDKRPLQEALKFLD